MTEQKRDNAFYEWWAASPVRLKALSAGESSWNHVPSLKDAFYGAWEIQQEKIDRLEDKHDEDVYRLATKMDQMEAEKTLLRRERDALIAVIAATKP